MSLLILNASPRPDGIISSLAAVAADEARALGAEAAVIDVNALHVAPCRGCMRCRDTGSCVLPPDDSLRVIAAMREADAIIVATPAYWANIPGTLKLLFDRMVYAMIDSHKAMPLPLLGGKRAACFVTCSTPRPWDSLFGQSTGAVRALRSIFRYSGVKISRVLTRPGTKAHPAVTPGDLTAARKITRRLLRKEG